MTNSLTNVPAAACRICGGWTSQGGMSQHRNSLVPVMGRTGCTCHQLPIRKTIDLHNWTGESRDVVLSSDNKFSLYGYNFQLVAGESNDNCGEIKLVGEGWQHPLTSWWFETDGRWADDTSREAVFVRAVRYVANHV